jgi:hypothetical protein
MRSDLVNDIIIFLFLSRRETRLDANDDHLHLCTSLRNGHRGLISTQLMLAGVKRSRYLATIISVPRANLRCSRLGFCRICLPIVLPIISDHCCIRTTCIVDLLFWSPFGGICCYVALQGPMHPISTFRKVIPYSFHPTASICWKSNCTIMQPRSTGDRLLQALDLTSCLFSERDCIIH